MTGKIAPLPSEVLSRACSELGWSGFIQQAVLPLDRLAGFITQAPLVRSGVPRIIAFPRCRSVHTCLMGFSLDIAFIDAEGTVIALHESVPPWRFVAHPSAAATLERPALLETGRLQRKLKIELDPAGGFGILISAVSDSTS